MKSQEIGIKPTLHVVLAADNQMLDEVMVVAYGTAKKSSFTGAASSVNAEKVLKDVPVTSFEQALQGATTGLTVNSSSGQPGAGLSIRIRGTGSMMLNETSDSIKANDFDEAWYKKVIDDQHDTISLLKEKVKFLEKQIEEKRNVNYG